MEKSKETQVTSGNSSVPQMAKKSVTVPHLPQKRDAGPQSSSLKECAFSQALQYGVKRTKKTTQQKEHSKPLDYHKVLQWKKIDCSNNY